MKTLIIIRHAKAEKTFGNDKGRALTERGINDASLMSKRLLTNGYKIDKIIASSAKRTQETAEIFANAFNIEPNLITYFDNLYLGDPLDFFEAIEWLEENPDTLAVVGHNPGVTNFTNDVTKASIDDLPTCGIAIIKVDTDSWKNIEFCDKTLVVVDFPKNLA